MSHIGDIKYMLCNTKNYAKDLPVNTSTYLLMNFKADWHIT